MINVSKTLADLLKEETDQWRGAAEDQFTSGEPPIAVETLLENAATRTPGRLSTSVRLIELLEQDAELVVPVPPAEPDEAPWNASQPWLESDAEGQLAIDVYQTPEAIVVRSPIAGVNPADIDITLHHDLLTIRGRRTIEEDVADEQYLYRECHWGGFSRSLILPAAVDAKAIQARFHRGVLTIVLPKIASMDRIPVIAEDDESSVEEGE